MLQLSRYNPTWLTRVPIAHRGLHSDGVPENSLPAFKAAVTGGYGIELDLRMSVDGQLVVIHDATTDRMTGKSLRVSQVSADRLSTLALAETTFTIPTLDTALGAIRGAVPVIIEIKTGVPMNDLGPKLMRVLAGYKGEVAISSYDPRVLLWMRKHAGGVPRIQIAGTVPERRAPLVLKLLLRTMPLNAWTRPDVIGFDCREYPNRILALWQRALGVPLLFYTVRTPAQLTKAHSVGCNYMFEKIRPPEGA